MTDPLDEGPGTRAIDAALARLYGGAKPRRFSPEVPLELGGEDPLDRVCAWASTRGRPHWHLVSYGLSELYEKDSPWKDRSGFGFELTLRLPRPEGEADPPAWAVELLQGLARYVFRTGNVFDVGHVMDVGEPLAPGARTGMRGVAFALDPELGRLDTPFGQVTFLQAVGITREEAQEVGDGLAHAVLERLARRDPLLLTDLDRDPV